jgi:hypothetical protein
MGERMERVVAAVRRLFEDLSVDVTEERVVRYIIEELQRCRGFDSVLGDPYVLNNTDETDRARLLENPEILRSIEDEILCEFNDYSRTTGGTTEPGA